jgi:hypothetical protein
MNRLINISYIKEFYSSPDGYFEGDKNPLKKMKLYFDKGPEKEQKSVI